MSNSRRNQPSNQKSARRNVRAGPQNRGNRTTNTVRAPTAMNKSSRQSGSNSSRYRECERVLTVVGSVEFTNVSDLPCNPGIASSFPWLSGHAALYESYKVHSITYRYKNLKGTGSDGNILMSFDYDTLDGAPSTAIEQSQATVWMDGAPWRIFEMKVPCHKRPLFTRAAPVPGSDLKTYDFGRLHVSAEGCADSSAHGYLEVEYDIELFDKQTGGSSTAPSTPVRSSIFSAPAFQTDALLDVIMAFDTPLGNGLGITLLAGGTFVVPAGIYLVTVNCNNVSGSSTYCSLDILKTGIAAGVFTGRRFGSMAMAVESDGVEPISFRLNTLNVTPLVESTVIFTLA